MNFFHIQKNVRKEIRSNRLDPFGTPNPGHCQAPSTPAIGFPMGKAGENPKKTNKLWKKQQRNTASNFCVDIVSSDVVGSFNFSAQFSASNSHLLELWRKRTTPGWNWLPGCWEAACYKGYRLKVCSCNCVCWPISNNIYSVWLDPKKYVQRMVESLFHAQWLQLIWHDFSDMTLKRESLDPGSHDHRIAVFFAWTSGCPRGVGPKKNQPSQRSTRKNARTPNHGLVQSYGSGKGQPRTSCQLQEIEWTLANIFLQQTGANSALLTADLYICLSFHQLDQKKWPSSSKLSIRSLWSFFLFRGDPGHKKAILGTILWVHGFCAMICQLVVKSPNLSASTKASPSLVNRSNRVKKCFGKTWIWVNNDRIHWTAVKKPSAFSIKGYWCPPTLASSFNKILKPALDFSWESWGEMSVPELHKKVQTFKPSKPCAYPNKPNKDKRKLVVWFQREHTFKVMSWIFLSNRWPLGKVGAIKF